MKVTPRWLRRVGAVALLVVLAPAPTAASTLWGYGVNSCEKFLDAAAGFERGDQTDEYRRYREWLAGFISGVNLATGQDVLRGAELEAALVRIAADCRGEPRMDFFNAAMGFVRFLMRLDDGRS
ncbi:hypothetical protein ABC977_11730 [Thioalkalicoccus limnaeus]|uniref:Rap1a immunity protein domain-containing protein n=1 Tax=Thioalkalicoccus limnaeus TaxID=120681 RepID=A0ABV4BH16_9GAMM